MRGRQLTNFEKRLGTLDDALRMGVALHIAAAVKDVNLAKGTSWRVVSKLAGGHSAGAYLLIAADGSRAVLKVHPQDVSADRVQATARLIDRAIAGGWRTPRWLASGVLEHGGFYVVQEFLNGDRAERLSEPVLGSLLRVNRLQADLRPEIDRDWSAHVWSVVFERGSRPAERMEQRADSAALLRRLQAMTKSAEATSLPATDLVHGDFTLDNAVFSEGDAYMVDADFAGKGCRAIDLAILLVQAATAEIGASTMSIDRLRTECAQVIGTQGLLVCVAARIIGLIDFGMDHWPSDVPSFVARCDPFLDRLGAT